MDIMDVCAIPTVHITLEWLWLTELYHSKTTTYKGIYQWTKKVRGKESDTQMGQTPAIHL